MYITFCRRYEGDKDDGLVSPDSKLCVQLDGEKSKKTEVKKEENTIVYKMVCLILSICCLILLLVVIVLATKQPLRAGPEPACKKNDSSPSASTCSLQTCQMLYNTSPKQHTCTQQHCKEDWLFFDGSCYFLSTFRLSWGESREKCISMGGSLATIKSPKLQTFLTNTSDFMYWIGLNQSNHIWTWVDNTELQKSYWGQQSQTGDCVYLHTAGHPEKNWIKKQCHLYIYFICQMYIQ